MSKRVSLLTLALCSALSPVQSIAQQPQAKPKPSKTTAKKPAAAAEVDPMAEIQRTTAVSLVTTLADEARTFREPGLRSRVQARAADALWETDREKAVTLFRRAWDEAESADAEADRDRKSTRLNSSHGYIAYAVFCLKKKNKLHPECRPE